MNALIAYLTIYTILVAGVVSIIWFVRDVRKQNSKVLKSILEIQIRQEEGQRKGFLLLSENLLAVQQSIAVMQDGIQKSIAVMQDGIQKSIAAMQDGIQKELRYIAELLAIKKNS